MASKTHKKISLADWLQTSLIRACRAHFAFVAVLAVYIIASDATHLITPERVMQRWQIAGFLLAATAIVWYVARHNMKSPNYYRFLIYILIAVDLFVATFSIYTQRGMASRAVILYVIPIVLSAILLSRTAIFMTATLATTSYVLAAVKYFVDFFNEGYKAELYIEVSFYCAVFFVIAAVLSYLVKFSRPEKDLHL